MALLPGFGSMKVILYNTLLMVVIIREEADIWT